MTVDTIINLKTLTCQKETDASGHSEPYIWPVLLKIDSDTLATDRLLDVITPTFGHERVPIRNGIRPGDTAAIPRSVGRLKARFEEDQQVHRLILIVTLLEEDETPEDSVQAGFREYADALADEIRENLFALSTAPEDDREKIIERIKTNVRKRVESAIQDSLSSFEKIKVLIGALNLDDVVSNEFLSFDDPLTSTSPDFTLTFTKGSTESYTIEGELTTKEVPEETCVREQRAVAEARKAMKGIETLIESLQAQLRNAPPPQKAALVKQIRKLKSEDFAKAEARFNAALKTLKLCRAERDQLVPMTESMVGGDTSKNRFKS